MQLTLSNFFIAALVLGLICFVWSVIQFDIACERNGEGAFVFCSPSLSDLFHMGKKISFTINGFQREASYVSSVGKSTIETSKGVYKHFKEGESRFPFKVKLRYQFEEYSFFILDHEGEEAVPFDLESNLNALEKKMPLYAINETEFVFLKVDD